MNRHKHQEKQAMGCVCMHLVMSCYAVSQPVCACCFPVHGNWTQWAIVSAGCQRRFVTARGGSASFHQLRIWSLVAVYLCNRAERGELSENRSAGMGTAFPINLWFMLISFETLKKDALWAGISICALTALLTLKTEWWLQHSQKQVKEKDGKRVLRLV